MSKNTGSRSKKSGSQGNSQETLSEYPFWVFSAAVVISPLVFFTNVTRNPYIIQNIIFRSLVFVSMILIIFSKKDCVLRVRTFLDTPLFVYGILIFLSLFVSLVKYPLWRTSYFVFWGKRIIFFIFNAVAVFYISFLMAKNKRFKKVLIYSLILTATISSLYAIIQYTGHEFIWPQNLHHYGSRSVSTFGNPNFLSAFEIVVVMLSLWLFFTAENFRATAISVFFTAVNFFALLITQTRSSWGGFAVAFVIFTAFSFKKIGAKKILSSVILLTAVSWIFPYLAYMRDHPTVLQRVLASTNFSESGDSSSVDQRLLIWEAAVRMFKQSPLIGHGWGSFEIRYPYEQGKILETKRQYANLRTHANNSHDEILEQLSQIGVIGLMSYAFIWFIFLKKTAQGYFAGKTLLLLATTASVLGFFADNMLNVTLNFPMPVLAFWACCGVACAESSDEEFLVYKKINSVIVLKIAAAFLLLLFVRGQIRYFKGEVNYFKGFSLSRSGDLALAAASCKKSWDYYKWNTDNNYELGNCYMRTREIQKAVWAYKEALKANPGYDEIYFNLAIAQQASGQIDDAEKNFIEAGEINPVSPEYFLSLGNFYLKNETKKDYVKAGAYYTKGLEINPSSLDALNNMAYLKRMEGKIHDSLALYQRALKINPAYELAEKNTVEVLRQLGVPVRKWHEEAADYVRLRQFAKAVPLYEKIIDQNPGDVLALFYLGNCYTSLDEYEKAVEIYENLVGFFPKEKNFVMNLAKIYILKGEKGRAEKLLKDVSCQFPDNAEMRVLMRKLEK